VLILAANTDGDDNIFDVDEIEKGKGLFPLMAMTMTDDGVKGYLGFADNGNDNADDYDRGDSDNALQ